MINDLEEILKLAELRQLDVGNDRQLYVDFIQRQIAVHPEYDFSWFPGQRKRSPLPYINLMADKVIIFAYLIRRIPVVEVYQDGTILDSTEKLRRLRHRGGYANWRDRDLVILAKRRDKAANNLFDDTNLRYTALITEIGQDEQVIHLWGHAISYEEHVSSSPRSPGRKRPRREKSSLD